MAIDGKYGRVTLEHGTIGEDEPVVVFRAQDSLLPSLLDYYADLCAENGSPERHIRLVEGALETVRAWQASNPTKTPDSESSRAWMA